jgi:hypothetical protein
MHPAIDCIGCTPAMRERDVSPTLGISRRKLLALVDEGVLQRPRRGVVVGRCVVEATADDAQRRHELRLRTLLLTHPACVASHESAALMLGLPLLNLPTWAIATRERGAWRGGPTERVRIAPLPAHHVAAAMRCTAVTRTVIDIARSSSLRDATVVGDAALRGACTLADLELTLDECSQWADVGKARRAISFLDGRSESALESVSRVVMHEHGLPAPALQTEFDITPGRGRYRVDFYWKDAQVVGEADGLLKYSDPTVLQAEKIRQERLEQLGIKVVRWTWREILVDTDATMRRLLGALRR